MAQPTQARVGQIHLRVLRLLGHDDDGNLDYVSEEDYTEELWNEQKKSGERNRAAALHK